jgi:hypothetical protein
VWFGELFCVVWSQKSELEAVFVVVRSRGVMEPTVSRLGNTLVKMT